MSALDPHVDDLLSDDALGLLSELLPRALPWPRPSSRVRSALLDQVGGKLRFFPFASRVARMFHLEEAAAERLLTQLVDDSAWIEGPIPGFYLSPAFVGPTLPGATAAFIKAIPGVRFPHHKHVGDETILVMQGLFQNGDGRVSGPGEVVFQPSGSSHDFLIPEGMDCVSAYLTLGGIEL